MHSHEEMGPNVPAFLAKLWRMVEDPETNDLINWNPSGTSFIIRNQARFSRELLPVYYKHNNMASFVRQLNMYGFHKVVSIEGGGLKVDKDEMEFAHSCFLNGHPYLLEHIKRKIPAKLEEGRSAPKTELVNRVLSDVKSMKGRQDNLDSQLSAMKRENEVLWREVAILRQKHLKQQQIVNKLIQFLISLAHSRNGFGIKRHYPLMLHDKAHRDTTHHQSSKNKHKQETNPQDSHDATDVPNHLSPTGPVIHELEPADLPDECISCENDDATGSEFLSVDFGDVTQGEVHSPASSSSKSSNPVTLNESNCDVLLELAEEYPLSPEMLNAAPPAEVNPCITSSKDKTKALGMLNNRKRKAEMVQIKKEVVEQPSEVDVGEFLEIVLPDLEATVQSLDPSVETIISTELLDTNNLNTVEINTTDQKDNSLEAATDAAISAITSVAAESAATTVSVPVNEITEEDTTEADIPNEEAVIDGALNISPSDLSLSCISNNSSGIPSIKSKEELDSHLGGTQFELDGLKDLLKGEGYSLDANTLLGVCPALLGLERDDVMKLFSDDPMAFGIHIMEENEDKTKEICPTDPLVSGNELATYSSNLLDLADLNSDLDDWTLPENDNEVVNYSNEVNTPQVLLVDGLDFGNTPAKKRKK